MERLILAVFRRPALATFIVFAITAVAVVGTKRLAFDDGLRSVFASQTDAYRDYQREVQLFAPHDSDIAIHLSAPDFADPSAFAAVENFVLELGVSSEISAVASPLSLRAKPDADGVASPIFGPELASADELRAALKRAADHPLNRGRLLAPGLHDMLVVARLVDQKINAVSATIGEIQSLADQTFAGTPVRYGITGLPVLRAGVIAAITRDQTIINAVGAAIGFALCLAAFRNLSLAFIAGFPAVLALIWVLGFLGFSGIGINTLTSALPVLIMVLGFSDGMHLTFEMRRRAAAGDGTETSIVGALRFAGPACFMTSLTTAVAFATLYLSRSELVRGLATAGVCAVTITLVAVLAVTPLLTAWLGRLAPVERALAASTAPLPFPSRFWSRVIDAILARRVLVACGGTALTVAVILVSAHLEPRHSFFEEVDRNSPEFVEFETVERLFAPLSTIDVVVPTYGAGLDGLSASSLRRLGEIHNALAGSFGAMRVLSLWNVATWLDPDAPDTAGPAIGRLLDEVDDVNGNSLITRDHSAMKIELATSDTQADSVGALAARVTLVAAAAIADDLPPPRVGGQPVMAANVSRIMLSDLNRSFLAAVVLSCLAIAIWCRSVLIGALALLPNILPIAALGSWLVLSGNGLQFTSGLAMTIAFGIAVDDTLHALNRIRPKLLRGEKITIGDLRTAFDEVTPVLAATTVILCCGLSATQLSQVPTIVYFGELSIAILIVALIADIAMLPALLGAFVNLRVMGKRP
jgi:predicted RND superfamily exporter protein